MLASLGIPLTINLVKKVLGKGIYLQPPKGKGVHIQPLSGRGMRLEPPPPVVGSRKNKFVDVPLSNFDLRDWCEYLKIPLKEIFARNEKMGKNHSPCIMNLDSLEGFGTHWVCCWFSKNHFTFGLLPPLEWEENVKKGFQR